MENAEETDKKTPDMSILLQFAKFSKGFRISDFEEFIREYIGLENLEFFGRLAYPNQWQMRVSKPKIREKLIRMGKTRINRRSCWIYPLNQQEIRGFVHWLPNSVTNDQLMEQLKLYGNVLILESQERIIKGRKVESDPRYYCLILPQGTTKEALPHFLKINGFLCHLAIRGRVPACFHCKEVGHHRTECAKRKVKISSFCNRDPNTGQPRLRPRGKRHTTAKTEDKDESRGIVEVLEQIQQRTSEDIRQRFQNFGNEIAQTLTGGKFSVYQQQNTVSKSVGASTNLEQGMSNEELEMQTKETGILRETTFTPVEIPGEESNADTNITKRKEDEITAIHPTMDQGKEDIAETHEKISNKTEEKTRSNVPTEKIALILEKTKQIFSKTIENTFKKLEKAASLKELEVFSIESDIDSEQKLAKDETRPELVMLEQAKQISLDHFENTFKKLEEKIASLSVQLASELTVTDTKLTKEDLDFASQMLEQTKQTVGGTLQSTFKKLTGKIEKEVNPVEIITESSTSKIVESSKQSAEILDQCKQKALDIVKQFDKVMKEAIAYEITEQKSVADEKNQDTNLSESDTGAASQDFFEVIGVSESTKASEKAKNKKDFSANTGFEPQVSIATLKNMDEFQKDVRKVFKSFLEKEKLLPETNAILKKVESKVNEIVEKMLNRE